MLSVISKSIITRFYHICIYFLPSALAEIKEERQYANQNGSGNGKPAFGRKYPSNPIIAGLVKEDLFNGVFVANKDSKCLIYKVPVTEQQYSDLKTGLDKFMSEQSKYRYNFAGLLALRWNMPLKRKYHYFCSQFVSELLINSNIAELKKSPELIKPCELIDINNKLLVFEGTIADFAEKVNLNNACN